MRRQINILTFVLSVFLLASCTEESRETNKEIVEGIPTTVSMVYNPSTPQEIETRAGEDQSAYENNVYDLNIFVFDEKGNFKTHKEIEFTGNQIASSGNVSFETSSGKSLIYAIANLKGSSLYSDAFKNKLSNFNGSKTELSDFVAELQQSTVNLTDGRFIMSGYFKQTGTSDTSEKGYCEILPPAKGSTSSILNGKIELMRIVSAITFDISTDIPSINNQPSSFVPATWQVINVPKKSFLFGKDTDAMGTNEDYFQTDAYNFLSNQSKFTFYITENRKTSADNVTINDYNEREAAGKYPENATYLKITGDYKGPGKKYEDKNDQTPSNESVSAKVTYYIHLGYVGNILSDFKSERNKKYTYKVKVTGINQIILEVVDESKPYHRGDGDVIYTTGGKMIEADAHNVTVNLKFNKSELSKSTNDAAYDFLVKSPKTKGIYKKDDYQWVKFYINEKNNNKYSTTSKVYPGDNNANLITIDKLLDNLKKAKALEEATPGNSSLFDENGDVIYTCYIYEYYYDDNNWSEFANKDNREMLILCSTQEGNNSSLTDAAYIISQKSIQTIYSMDNSLKAWGIEWVNESGVKGSQNGEMSLYYGPNNNNQSNSWNTPFSGTNPVSTDDNYGRPNMIAEINRTNKHSWNNTEISDNTQQKAYIACMSRNRDENGDGKINDNEIKWYLPAINQYQDLWVGIDAINKDARLYTKNYFTSVHYFSNGKRRVFWSEEGGSTSAWGEYAGFASLNAGKRSIRCARNLGSTEEKPNDYIIKNTDNSDYYEFTLSNLNKGCLRSDYITVDLTRNFETDENNRPYKKFRVKKVPYQNNQTWATHNNNQDTGEKVCPKGWRIPNQREYSIFSMRIGANEKAVTRTCFSYRIDSNTSGSKISNIGSANRFYFFQNGGIGLSVGGDKGFVRCVQDVY